VALPKRDRKTKQATEEIQTLGTNFEQTHAIKRGNAMEERKSDPLGARKGVRKNRGTGKKTRGLTGATETLTDTTLKPFSSRDSSENGVHKTRIPVSYRR